MAVETGASFASPPTARHGLLPVHLQALAYLSAANRCSDIPIALAEYFGTTRGTVSQTLAVLAALQRQNANRAFGVCWQCAHFRPEADGFHCGLTARH